MDRPILAAERELYENDGVVLLKGLLSGDELAVLEQAYQYSFDHPGPGARDLYPDSEGRFYQDGSNMSNWDYYASILRKHSLPQVCRDLWDADDVWFMNEQIFLKEGRQTRRTPWHQDASYTPYDGRQLAIMWINFDPVPRANTLEFIRGSHLDRLFSGPAFDPSDDTAPMRSDNVLPRLPDIEGERDRWDIISFPVEPGDVVVFHNRTLHGGAATDLGNRRRTLSLRFFGADVVRVTRNDEESEVGEGQLDSSLMSSWGELVNSLLPGQPLSEHSAFRRV